MQPVSIITLGDQIDQGFTVSAYCENQACRHSVDLDLDALAEKLGRGFVTVGSPNPLVARLHCAKCKGKDISLILSPPGTTKPAGSHNRSR